MLKKMLITAAALGLAAVTFGVSTAALAQPPYPAPVYRPVVPVAPIPAPAPL